MSFIDFFKSVLGLLGSGGALLLAVVVFLLSLGIYKFVKDLLPW